MPISFLISDCALPMVTIRNKDIYTILIIRVITREAKYKHKIMYGEVWAMLPYYTVSISHALTSMLSLLCQVELGSPIKMSQRL